jgi:hypothetical protein
VSLYQQLLTARETQLTLRRVVHRPRRPSRRRPPLTVTRRRSARSARRPTLLTSTRSSSRSTPTLVSPTRPCSSSTRLSTTSLSASPARPPSSLPTTRSRPSLPARSRPVSFRLAFHCSATTMIWKLTQFALTNSGPPHPSRRALQARHLRGHQGRHQGSSSRFLAHRSRYSALTFSSPPPTVLLLQVEQLDAPHLHTHTHTSFFNHYHHFALLFRARNAMPYPTLHSQSAENSERRDNCFGQA